MENNRNGNEVVLTSDKTLLTTYGNNLYMGLAASLPTNVCPDFLYFSLLCPPVDVSLDGSVALATPSLRTVEAILVNSGVVSKENLKIVHPDYLEEHVGKKTKILGISAMDPLGLGPSTTTWSTIFAGIPHTRAEFLRLMLGQVKQLKEKYGFRVVLGGSGSWQVSLAGLIDKLGIDYIVTGEGERTIPTLFNNLLKGKKPSERVIDGPIAKPKEIPPILGPSIFGLVEISRGCGRGCRFCVPATSGKMRMLPLEEKIIPDIKVHVESGIKAITFQSDDALRYGSNGFLMDEDALINLYKSAFEAGAKEVYITHSTLAPIAHQPEVIEKLTKLLRKHGHKYYGCQPGIETGSSRLIGKLMAGKPKPYSADEWPEMVKEAMRTMAENRWVTVSTLMVGLPEEEEEDIEETIDLIKDLRPYPSLFVPLFFVPMEHCTLRGAKAFIANYMSKKHWELILTCWKHNVLHIDPLYSLTTEQHSLGSRLGILLLTRLLKIFLNLKEREISGKSSLMRALQRIFYGRFSKMPTTEKEILEKTYGKKQ